MMHDDFKEVVLEALNRLYGDTSVPRSQTKESLEEIREQIDLMIETLDN